MKKYYSIGLTIVFFAFLTSLISPNVVVNTQAQTNEIEEDFSTPVPNASQTPKSSSTAAAKASTNPTTNPETQSKKMIAYKGDISATPSAIGKLLILTPDGQKNIDTDKLTKVFVYDKGIKTISTVAKIKMGDQSSIIGAPTTDGKSLLAKYILINRNPIQEPPKSSKYGLVASREASGTAAFVLQIKSPNKDEETTNYIVNNETTVTVKDNDSSKLSDIKIGDRVTFTFYKDEKTNNNLITRVFVIPGRAAGLLKDIREASAVAEKQAKDQDNNKTSPKPTATSSASPR